MFSYHSFSYLPNQLVELVDDVDMFSLELVMKSFSAFYVMVVLLLLDLHTCGVVI